MPLAKGFPAPLEADLVERPHVVYGGPQPGIYFPTEDWMHARVTFENLDALKISRGEYLPYATNPNDADPYCWVSKVEDSDWLKERFNYERKYYGSSYQFGGHVGEMLTDFSHYVFSFHDEFVETIARGIWFEKDEVSLFEKPLGAGHPFLPLLPSEADEAWVAHGLTCCVRASPKAVPDLVSDARYCSQKLAEFALELDGSASVSFTLILAYRSGNLISSLRDYFHREVAQFGGVAVTSHAEPFVKKHMQEVSERRTAMGKL